ncbi:MAG: permease, partial [Tissierellia bacterium]|nr:permease [Tissierellia bacterium]
MQTKIFYGVALLLTAISFFKDKKKTKQSMKKAWKSFENILPQMLGMITTFGIIIAFLSPETISKIIGGSSGWYGTIAGALVGSITLIPAFVAFPMAAILLENGAGYMQLSAFV